MKKQRSIPHIEVDTEGLTANKELAKCARINMNEPPHLICQFLHCYTQLPPRRRDRKHQTCQEVLHMFCEHSILIKSN